MNDFCKIYQCNGEQVLIMFREPVDDYENEVEIRMFYNAHGLTLGICECAVGYKTWEAGEKHFRELTQEFVENWYNSVYAVAADLIK